MPSRTVLRPASVAAFVVVLAAPLLAAPSAQDEARRLDDRRFFVLGLKRGWDPLLADAAKTLDAFHGAAAPQEALVHDAADNARTSVADHWLLEHTPAGDDRAYPVLDLLARTARDEKARPSFHVKCADVDVARADREEKAGHDDAAFECAKRALSHVPRLARALEVIKSLGVKVGERLETEQDFEKALDRYEVTFRTLVDAGARPDDAAARDVEARRSRVVETTGVPSVTWLGNPAELLRVKGGPLTDFTAARLEFAPQQGGAKPPELTAKSLRRIRCGAYAVTAQGDGPGEPQRAQVTVTKDGGTLSLISVLPDGMVLVPAAGEDDAFLIDRTEVSNDRWRAMTGQSRPGPGNLAVAGISLTDAQRAAAAAGKRLPTLAQWTHAAFGAPYARSPRYPWGNDAGTPGRHFVANASGPQPVDSCPDGHSPFGCVNMVGNVWEWIDKDGGWLIGFGWNLSNAAELDSDMEWPPGTNDKPWRADLLRDPIPSPDGYQRISDPGERRRWKQNVAQADGALAMAGLRCVVPLGKPWR